MGIHSGPVAPEDRDITNKDLARFLQNLADRRLSADNADAHRWLRLAAERLLLTGR